jgi:hypothetical protein
MNSHRIPQAIFRKKLWTFPSYKSEFLMKELSVLKNINASYAGP